jgi:hypothetical protein
MAMTSSNLYLHDDPQVLLWLYEWGLHNHLMRQLATATCT